MSFKVDIEVNTENTPHKVTFTPRQPGEIGKDILAVKIALGLLASYDQNGNLVQDYEAETNIPLDKNKWFDCTNGLGIDLLRASTFDRKMQTALMNYQIKNRYLISHYLFETWCVDKILPFSSTSYDTSEQFDKYKLGISSIYYELPNLFDLEFGSLGPATLAVMHGWTPSSSFYNSGYRHDENKYSQQEQIIEIIPDVFFLDIQAGFYEQNLQDLTDNNILNSAELKVPSREEYKNYMDLKESRFNWVRIPENDPDSENVSFKYPINVAVLKVPKNRTVTSLLYRACLQTSPEDTQYNSSSTLSSERQQRARKFFDPDPFSSPDPFYIDEDKIGFFDNTEFYLRPSGPHPNSSQEIIEQLEDDALDKILKFYNKPELWNFSLKRGPERDLIEQQYSFISNFDQSPNHTGIYPLSAPIGSSLNSSRFEKDYRYTQIKKRINILESEINGLNNRKEPRENYAYPPAGFNNEQDYRLFVDEKIDEKKQNIEQLKNQLNSYITQNKEFSFLVLASQNTLTKVTADSAKSWREIEDSSSNPLIKFVEYRTPSLRPNQPYVAYFEINKKKLDLIVYGDNVSSVAQNIQSTMSSDPPSNLPDACYNQPSDQQTRTLEEYKIFAKKKQREFVRQMKAQYANRVEANYRTGQDPNSQADVNIDLGEIGPFNFNNAFSSIYGLNNVQSDRDYMRQVSSALIGGSNAALEALGWFDTDEQNLQDIIDSHNLFGGEEAKEKAKGSSFNKLTITLETLQRRIETASADIRRAGQIMQREGIKLEPGSNFQADKEVQLLKRFYSQLIEYLDESLRGFVENLGIESIGSLDPSDVYLFFRFENTGKNVDIGPKIGKKIISLKAGTDQSSFFDFSKDIFWSENILEPYQGPNEVRKEIYKGSDISKYDALSRARTVNYISNIVSMTSPFAGDGFWDTAANMFVSFFDDAMNFCEELGIDSEKHAALSMVGTFTSGIKVIIPKEEPFEVFKDWATKNFADPAVAWWETSGDNLKSSLDDTFDEDKALRSLGKLCTIEQIYEEFVDKVNLSSMLCNYLECIKLPGFSLKLPSLYLPPIPKMPIIGWYGALLEFLYKQFVEILTRILCTLVRTIIDKLAFPFCEDQLRDFIAAGSSATPLLNQALAESLTNTGITGIRNPDPEEAEKASQSAKDFFTDATKIVTGQELCHLLEGKELDAAGMSMLKRLAEKNNLSLDFNNSESIANFFGVIGSYVPLELCSQLSNVEVQLGAASCEDISDELRAIRNRLQNNENDDSMTPEEINRILDLAEKNAQDKKETLQSFSGSNLSMFLPPELKDNVGLGNIMVGQLPPSVKRQFALLMSSLFQSVKTSYLKSLNSFVPSLAASIPQNARPGDPSFDDLSVLRLETALEQMKNFSMALERKKYLRLGRNDGEADRDLFGGKSFIELNDPLSLQSDVTPDVVAELFKLFMLERVDLPSGQATPDGRSYHLVHKRQAPKKVAGIFDMAEQGEAPDQFGIFQQGSGLLLTHLEYKDFDRISWQDFYNVKSPTLAEDEPKDILKDIYYSSDQIFSRDRELTQKRTYNHLLFLGSLDLEEYALRPEARNITNLIPIINEKQPQDPKFDEEYGSGQICPEVIYTNPAVDQSFTENPIDFDERFGDDTHIRNDFLAAQFCRKPVNRLFLGPNQSRRTPFNTLVLNRFGLIDNFKQSFVLSRNLPYTPDYLGFSTAREYYTSLRSETQDVITDILLGDSDNKLDLSRIAVLDAAMFPRDENLPNSTIVERADQWYEDLVERGVNGGLTMPNATAFTKVNEKLGILENFYLEEYLKNHSKLLQIMRNRLLELNSIITEEITRLPRNMVEKYLPSISDIILKMSRYNSQLSGDTNYSLVPGSTPQQLVSLDYISMIVQAGPYRPSVKKAELATKKKTLDAYNIVVENNFFLRQPLPSYVKGQTNLDPFTSVETLNGKDTKERKIFKFCENIPEHIVSQNRQSFDPSGNPYQDHPRREAYAQFMKKIIKGYIPNIILDDTELDGLKTHVFKSTAETILSELQKSIAYAPLFSSAYSENLQDRISSNRYIVPNTKCLKNRYGLNENSLMSFNELMLSEAMDILQSEFKKPEHSLFKRSYSKPEAFHSAAKSISFSIFVKVCTLDFILKSGLANSLWSLEPIFSQPVTLEYVLAHVTEELNRSSYFRYNWGAIIEQIRGTANKQEALRGYLRDLMKDLPLLTRQIFNPGMGSKDFYNWHTHGLTASRRVQNIPELDESFESRNGLFKRLPVPSHREPVRDSPNEHWIPESHIDETFRAFPVFERNKTRALDLDFNGEEEVQPLEGQFTGCSEFIYEDYIRMSGAILNDILDPRTDKQPRNRYRLPFINTGDIERHLQNFNIQAYYDHENGVEALQPEELDQLKASLYRNAPMFDYSENLYKYQNAPIQRWTLNLNIDDQMQRELDEGLQIWHVDFAMCIYNMVYLRGLWEYFRYKLRTTSWEFSLAHNPGMFFANHAEDLDWEFLLDDGQDPGNPPVEVDADGNAQGGVVGGAPSNEYIKSRGATILSGLYIYAQRCQIYCDLLGVNLQIPFHNIYSRIRENAIRPEERLPVLLIEGQNYRTFSHEVPLPDREDWDPLTIHNETIRLMQSSLRLRFGNEDQIIHRYGQGALQEQPGNSGIQIETTTPFVGDASSIDGANSNPYNGRDAEQAPAQGDRHQDRDMWVYPSNYVAPRLTRDPGDPEAYRQLSGDRIVNLMGLNSRFDSVVVSIKEFDEMRAAMNTLVQNLNGRGFEQTIKDIEGAFENSTFHIGTRLTQVILADADNLDQSYDIIEKITSRPEIQDLAAKERAFLYGQKSSLLEQLPGDFFGANAEAFEQMNLLGTSIPIVSYETPLKLCFDRTENIVPFGGDIYNPEDPNFIKTMKNLEKRLSETPEYKALMDHLYPIRRYMAITTINSNSILAGFGTLPNLFESVKRLCSTVAFSASQSPNASLGKESDGFSSLYPNDLDPAEYNAKIENLTGDASDPKCFEFPGISEDFWNNFIDELEKLIKYLPSHLFRNLANLMDPAYKEMRAHYLNCDIKELSWSGVDSSNPGRRLINGLDLDGSNHGEKGGFYAPILPQLPIDLWKSLTPWPSGSELGYTISKTLAYAFTGFLPMIDLSTVFKVPCRDVDKNWLKDGKYDIGFKGRYGHPVSPITALALSTLQLPADRQKRNSNCPDNGITDIEVSENSEDCEDID